LTNVKSGTAVSGVSGEVGKFKLKIATRGSSRPPQRASLIFRSTKKVTEASLVSDIKKREGSTYSSRLGGGGRRTNVVFRPESFHGETQL